MKKDKCIPVDVWDKEGACITKRFCTEEEAIKFAVEEAKWEGTKYCRLWNGEVIKGDYTT